MNVLDWIVCILLVAAAVIGYRRGLITQLVSIAGLVLAYLLAYRFYKEAAPWLGKLIPLRTFEAYGRYEFAVKVLHVNDFVLNALSFALIFFAVKIGVSLLSRVLNLVAKAPGLNLLNRWAGLGLAVAECLLLAVIAVNVMTVLPSDNVQELLASSRSAHWMMERLPIDFGKLQKLWNGGGSGSGWI